MGQVLNAGARKFKRIQIWREATIGLFFDLFKTSLGFFKFYADAKCHPSQNCVRIIIFLLFLYKKRVMLIKKRCKFFTKIYKLIEMTTFSCYVSRNCNIAKDVSWDNDKASFGCSSASLIFVALVTVAVHLLMAAACLVNIASIRFPLLCLSLFIMVNKHEWITWIWRLLQGVEGHSLFSLTD